MIQRSTKKEKQKDVREGLREEQFDQRLEKGSKRDSGGLAFQERSATLSPSEGIQDSGQSTCLWCLAAGRVLQFQLADSVLEGR